VIDPPRRGDSLFAFLRSAFITLRFDRCLPGLSGTAGTRDSAPASFRQHGSYIDLTTRAVRVIIGEIAMRIAAESVVLGFLCLLDMISTVWLLHTGQAMEANPLLNFYVTNGGLVSFAAAKTLLSLGPLFALEVLRRKHPRVVHSVLRAGIALYLITYGIGGAILNQRASAQDRDASSASIQREVGRTG
jgi:hypothetical protein